MIHLNHLSMTMNRYYGRRKENSSDSEISLDEEETSKEVPPADTRPRFQSSSGS